MRNFPQPPDRPRIIIDCDPGIDDAAAIVLALVRTELLGVTTCFGNAPLKETTDNAARILQLASESHPGARNIPIVPGADRPLVAEPPEPSPMHGPFDAGASVPSSILSGQTVHRHAADFIIETVLRSAEPVYLVCIGPLTNVALALHREPALREKVAGIAMMGGSASFGNVTPVAEFNVWADPEAAHIVISSGIPIRMCGLNVTRRVDVPGELQNRLAASPAPALRFLAQMFDFRRKRLATQGITTLSLHDPCAIFALVRPDLFEFQPMAVAVELNGALTRGMTVCDQRPGKYTRYSSLFVGTREPNAYVATDVDVQRVAETLVDELLVLESLGESGRQ